MNITKKGNLTIYPDHQRIILSGKIDSEEQRELSIILLYFQGKEVQLFIDSRGGLFVSGLAMFDAIKLHGKVTGVVMSVAFSSAFIAFQACSKRLIYPNAVMMTHAPTCHNVKTDAEKHFQEAGEMLKKHLSFLKSLSRKTGIEFEKLKKYSETEKYFFSREAVRLGLADKIISKLPPIL